MRVELQSVPVEPPYDFSSSNIEEQFINNMIGATEFFSYCPIRICEDGVYFTYAGRVFKMDISVAVESEVDESPLPFDKPGETEVIITSRKSFWQRIIFLLIKSMGGKAGNS